MHIPSATHLGAGAPRVSTRNQRAREDVMGRYWAREHGDATVLVLGADVTDDATAEQVLATFLSNAARGDCNAERRGRLAKLDISKL